MDNAVMTGYMNEWSHHKCNFTQMAEHAYDALIFSTADIHFRYVSMSQEFLKTHLRTKLISTDIEKVKSFGARRIFITLGSHKNSFKPKGKPEVIDHDILKFLYHYGFYGINFGDEMNVNIKSFIGKLRNEDMKAAHHRPSKLFNYSHLKTKVA